MLQLSMLEKNEFTHPFQGDFERLAVRKKEQELYNDEFYAKVTPDGTCIWSIFFVKRGVDPSYSLLIQRNKDIIRVHISRSSQDELPGRVVAKVFYPTVFSTDEEFDSNLLDGKTKEQLQHRVMNPWFKPGACSGGEFCPSLQARDMTRLSWHIQPG